MNPASRLALLRGAIDRLQMVADSLNCGNVTPRTAEAIARAIADARYAEEKLIALSPRLARYKKGKLQNVPE